MAFWFFLVISSFLLIWIITGQLAPDSGQVRLGANVRPGYFSQEQEGLDPA